MITTLLLPAALLVLFSVLITRGVEALMPETLTGIFLTALLSAVLLWLTSALMFAVLYTMQAPGATQLIRQGGAGHFAWLGIQAAMIWAPVLALVIVTAPRRWRKNTW